MTIAGSAKATIHATLVIWAKARIPTQRIDSCVRKLRKLYDDYFDLKRNRLTQKECFRVKEQLFESDLDELFDISTKDALATMSNEEDKHSTETSDGFSNERPIFPDFCLLGTTRPTIAIIKNNFWFK